MWKAKRAALAQRLAEAAKKSPPGVAKPRLIALSVVDKTQKQYASQLRLLEAFLVALGRRAPDDTSPVAASLTEDDYCSFLLSLVDVDEKIPGQVHSALRKQQETLGLPLWTESPSVQCALRGAKYRGGNTPKPLPRGTLTLKMFVALRNHIAEHYAHMVHGVVVQYGCVLRVSQLVSIRSGHVFLNPRRVWLVEDKRVNAKTFGTPQAGPHFKEIWDVAAFNVLWSLQTATPSGDLLFPRSKWTVPQYRAALVETCQHLNFPTEVKFDGSHILRHAGAGAAVRLLDPSEHATKMHMSPRMVKHYSRSLAQRLREKTRKKESSTPAKKAMRRPRHANECVPRTQK